MVCLDLQSGNTSLEQHDVELFNLIEAEKNRQWKCLELIASENFTSRAVMDCLGSCLTNKYAEGLPNQRYYGGNEVIDKVEVLCQQRALKAFSLDSEKWGVNVQPYSGSPANFAVYTGLLHPHDRIMGLDLPSGGHLTHGFYTYSKAEKTRKAVSATSVYFESLPYRVSSETGLIDFALLAEQAALYKPALIICGGSAYPRDWDYARFRKIADDNGALLMCDMAHYSGLVATGEHSSPFEYCDIVTTTTHKSLRGPRAGMIFFRKDERGFEAKINSAVFPALQGGPHEHQIAAVATQLKEVMTDEFKQYIKQVKSNAKTLAKTLTELGYTMCTGGTDNHLILWDLRPVGITGSKLEKLCDMVCITLNKNAVLGDRSALSPGGVRVGTPALTSRGFKEADFFKVAEFLDRAVKLCVEIQATSGKKLTDFVASAEKHAGVTQLRHDVNALATSFGMPGFDVASMRNKTLEE
ncbi:TPA: hypothetical protein N0F65_002144 [Lagenidium giganteum]|uniref:Serine hydroxymethyltransferase n=1 Tax=Lagenidium giganteum TaxID=4803 RepID=A0AAV2YS48_9STRA|nr:TPA: hypothetical protein N0F65_002144 [Lagenidium giganteum]